MDHMTRLVQQMTCFKFQEIVQSTSHKQCYYFINSLQFLLTAESNTVERYSVCCFKFQVSVSCIFSLKYLMHQLNAMHEFVGGSMKLAKSSVRMCE